MGLPQTRLHNEWTSWQVSETDLEGEKQSGEKQKQERKLLVQKCFLIKIPACYLQYRPTGSFKPLFKTFALLFAPFALLWIVICRQQRKVGVMAFVWPRNYWDICRVACCLLLPRKQPDVVAYLWHDWMAGRVTHQLRKQCFTYFRPQWGSEIWSASSLFAVFPRRSCDSYKYFQLQARLFRVMFGRIFKWFNLMSHVETPGFAISRV